MEPTKKVFDLKLYRDDRDMKLFVQWDKKDLEERPGRLMERMDWLNQYPDDLEVFLDQIDDICALSGAELEDDEAQFRRHVLSMGRRLAEQNVGEGHFALYFAWANGWPESVVSDQSAQHHLECAAKSGVAAAKDVLEDQRIDDAFNAEFPDHAQHPERYIALRRALRRILAQLADTRAGKS